MQNILLTFIFLIFLSFGTALSTEKVEFSVDDNLLTVNIINLYANCCSGFVSEYHINYNSNTITFTVSDTSSQNCKCNCNFDLMINLGPLPQGKYNVIVNREESAKKGFVKDRNINIGKKELYVYDPHPQSPLKMEFKQSPCKNLSEINTKDEVIRGGIEIFPNTAAGAVSVKFNLKENSNVNIKLLNFLGKEIDEFKFKNLRNGTNTLHLNIGELPPGMYIGKVLASSGQYYTFKLVWSK